MSEVEYKKTNISIYQRNEEELEKFRKSGWQVSDKIAVGKDKENKETFVFVVEREKR